MGGILSGDANRGKRVVDPRHALSSGMRLHIMTRSMSHTTMIGTTAESPSYLAPYIDAAARHGAQFPSLLWASPDTQAARFNAIARLADFEGKSVLDVGCGRADFVAFCAGRNIRLADYTGIAAV